MRRTADVEIERLVTIQALSSSNFKACEGALAKTKTLTRTRSHMSRCDYQPTTAAHVAHGIASNLTNCMRWTDYAAGRRDLRYHTPKSRLTDPKCM